VHLGIDASIVRWVADHHTFRQQRVAINGVTSDYTAVLSGVPQVSVLAPLLLQFLIYVDDLASLSISVGSQISMHADDLLLFRAISTKGDYCVLRNNVAAIEDCSSNANTWLYHEKNTNNSSLPNTPERYNRWRGLNCLSTLVLLFPPGPTT